MSDFERMAADVVEASKRFVSRAVAGLTERVNELVEMAAALDRRLNDLPAPKDGLPGASAFQIACMGGFQGSEGEWLESMRGRGGKDAEIDYGRIGDMLSAMVKAAVAALPEPVAGKSADPIETARLVDESVAAAVSAIPTPRDGKDADLDAMREFVLAEVDAAVSKLPMPQDGKSVDPETVERMIRGEVAHAVLMLPKPKDGENGKSVTIDDVRPMVDDVIREAVAKIPAPKDGVDGFGLEDFDVALKEDGRTLAFKFERGEVVKVHEIRLDIPLDTGVYKADREYTKGDGATWDGCWWLAQQSTKDKPGTSSAWRLTVKSGRDGKPGTSIKGDKGDQGRPGRDLTQMGFDGGKR